ncbi:allatostatin-A receptor-like [Exaiptasia diaphana]|uniref:G-protein coupled receptors family 1 profile domain-containing protein n=1 Tax=Exaiptasia diaphana TaxID=2652724 RepID=A0A913XXQ3_EXADI|nr:allatostatin-A receptor-like [Exaiptasia diaphana]XP_020910879.1 allatostatin-A receptor-like [Exaiptasia diaphana]XP_028517860.1 allatostatin-A receptor-like [Exaiptasia diaphana]
MATTGDIALDVVFSFISSIGVVGNILVCLVVLLNKPMRTPMNYLLVNLAISDMMLLVFLTMHFVFHHSLDDISCKVVSVFAWTGGYASSFFLVAIAVERFFAVTRPQDIQRRITITKVKIIALSCWLLALAWNSIGFKTRHFNSQLGRCKGKWRYNDARKAYKLLSFFFVGVLPVTIMFLLYSKVVYSLWFKTNKSPDSCTQIAALKNRQKVTKIVLSVSLLYAVCWLPELFLFVLKTYKPGVIQGTKSFAITVAILCINSAANPLIYCFHSQRFRCHLQKLLKCGNADSYRLKDTGSPSTTRVENQANLISTQADD